METAFALFPHQTFGSLESAFLNLRSLSLLATGMKCDDGSFQDRSFRERSFQKRSRVLLGALSENQRGNIGTRHPIWGVLAGLLRRARWVLVSRNTVRDEMTGPLSLVTGTHYCAGRTELQW